MSVLIFSECREINAPDHQVYDVIADLSQYPRWNPWLVHAEGTTTAGGSVSVSMHMAGAQRTFNHKMIAAEKPHLFHWCDVGWFTVFAFGERKRTIIARSVHECTYTVELRVSGIGAPLTKLLLGNFLQHGLRQESDALKNFVESR